jgi:hypothetical protein
LWLQYRKLANTNFRTFPCTLHAVVPLTGCTVGVVLFSDEQDEAETAWLLWAS